MMLTPTSVVAESDGFLCDHGAKRHTQKNGTFGNPLDVIVSIYVHNAHLISISLFSILFSLLYAFSSGVEDSLYSIHQL